MYSLQVLFCCALSTGVLVTVKVNNEFSSRFLFKVILKMMLLSIRTFIHCSASSTMVIKSQTFSCLAYHWTSAFLVIWHSAGMWRDFLILETLALGDKLHNKAYCTVVAVKFHYAAETRPVLSLQVCLLRRSSSLKFSCISFGNSLHLLCAPYYTVWSYI